MYNVLIVEDDPMARKLLEIFVATSENYHLVPSLDSAAMAEAILRIMNDKELYAELSAGAEKRFGEKFTAQAMTEQLENVYKEECRRCGFMK